MLEDLIEELIENRKKAAELNAEINRIQARNREITNALYNGEDFVKSENYSFRFSWWKTLNVTNWDALFLILKENGMRLDTAFSVSLYYNTEKALRWKKNFKDDWTDCVDVTETPIITKIKKIKNVKK